MAVSEDAVSTGHLQASRYALRTILKAMLPATANIRQISTIVPEVRDMFVCNGRPAAISVRAISASRAPKASTPTRFNAAVAPRL